MRKLLIIVAQFFFMTATYAQTQISKIVGEYTRIDNTLNSGMHSNLTVLKDGSYTYETGTHLQVNHSYGTWKLKGDTLIINSSIDAKNVPITIKEKRVDSLKNNITFMLVKNLDGGIMGALLHFNKDTALVCDPLMENGCNRKVGTIKSFKVEFTSEASSKWYKLKSKNANLIEITADVHDFLALYLYFKNERYLFKNGQLRYLPKNDIANESVEILIKSRYTIRTLFR